ncbi:hypothetical protein K1719_018575 [Acacia pycnantha]|nr:hypothetical protein K1719_018575 [Acacia pycnantha]
MEEYESDKKKLFSCAMRGEWDKVIEMYERDVRLHNARMPPSRETVLHIAVSNRKKYVVMEMLDVMSRTQHHHWGFIEALRTPDHRNNTALHSAASMGNAAICYSIARVEPTLVDDRNDDGETLSSWPPSMAEKKPFFVFISSETLTSRIPSMITAEGAMVTLSFTALSLMAILILHFK